MKNIRCVNPVMLSELFPNNWSFDGIEEKSKRKIFVSVNLPANGLEVILNKYPAVEYMYIDVYHMDTRQTIKTLMLRFK